MVLTHTNETGLYHHAPNHIAAHVSYFLTDCPIQDQSLRATCTDMTDGQSCIQPLSTCYKDDGSTNIQETLSSSLDNGGDDSKDGDDSDHSGNFSTPVSRSSDQSTKQNVTKVAEIKDPQQEYGLLTETHNLLLGLEAQDEVKSSLGIPHPFTTEG